MSHWILFQFPTLLLRFFPAFKSYPQGADVSEVPTLCWGGGYLLGGRAPFSSLSRCGKRSPVCLFNTGRAPFCEAERLGFFPLAVKLYSHRITTCLRFLKPFVQMSNSYCAGSKFRPWLSRPWNPFNLAPGSEAPRTHTKEGIKKKHSHT